MFSSSDIFLAVWLSLCRARNGDEPKCESPKKPRSQYKWVQLGAVSVCPAIVDWCNGMTVASVIRHKLHYAIGCRPLEHPRFRVRIITKTEIQAFFQQTRFRLRHTYSNPQKNPDLGCGAAQKDCDLF